MLKNMVSRQRRSQIRKADYFKQSPKYRLLTQQMEVYQLEKANQQLQLDEIIRSREETLKQIEGSSLSPNEIRKQKRVFISQNLKQRLTVKQNLRLIQAYIRQLRHKRRKALDQYLKHGKFNRYVVTTNGECKNKKEFMEKYNVPNTQYALNKALIEFVKKLQIQAEHDSQQPLENKNT